MRQPSPGDSVPFDPDIFAARLATTITSSDNQAVTGRSLLKNFQASEIGNCYKERPENILTGGKLWQEWFR
jgi:hypothetical protein